jgi:hypothetical protein
MSVGVRGEGEEGNVLVNSKNVFRLNHFSLATKSSGYLTFLGAKNSRHMGFPCDEAVLPV